MIFLLSLFLSVAQAGDFELRVLTYNIFGVPIVKMDTTRFADIGDLLDGMVAQGTAPHVVVIQEAMRPKTREVVRHARYPYVAWGPLCTGICTGSGLVILSQFPIEASQSHVFRNGAGWDAFARKGVMRAVVRVPGVPEPIQILDTHLQASSPENFWVSQRRMKQVRMAQIDEIQDFLATEGDTTIPTIFGGDFNFHSDSDEYQSLSSYLPFQDAALVGMVDHQFWLDGSSGQVRVRPAGFERFFTEPYHGRMLSDHLGLMVRYALSW